MVFLLNLEKASSPSKPEPEQEKRTVPTKVILHPHVPTEGPKTVPPELKVAPQRQAEPEPMVPRMQPQPEALRVEPAKKRAEAPEMRGNFLSVPSNQKDTCFLMSVIFLCVNLDHVDPI